MPDVPLQYLPSAYQQRLFGKLVPEGEEPDDDGWYFARCPTNGVGVEMAERVSGDLDAQINWAHGSIRCLHVDPCGSTKRGVRSLTTMMETFWLEYLRDRVL